MNQYKHKSLPVVISLVALFFIFSCGQRPIGYGVILWSQDESVIESGTITPVYSESRLQKTYDIGVPGTDTIITVENWRISFFNRRGDAEAYANRYREFGNLIGISLMNGLPIRREPRSNADRVYRLRKGEMVKILDRSETTSVEGGSESYWYHVLTEGGVSGYCFGHALNVGTFKDLLKEAEPPEKDPVLTRILKNTWRPEYFKTLINRRTVDLNRIQPEYGLFPDSAGKTIKIVTPSHSIDFVYSAITPSGVNSYVFEDTPLQISVISDSEIEVRYTAYQKEYREIYTILNYDIEEIIKNEVERRDKLFEQLIGMGNSFTSSAYGTLKVEEDRTFIWQDYSKLVPNVIPSGLMGTGKIEFSLFLTPELQEIYDGVVTFAFTAPGEEKRVSFLYRLQENGVRFLYIPEGDIRDMTVTRENPFPLIIFFTVEKS